MLVEIVDDIKVFSTKYILISLGLFSSYSYLINRFNDIFELEAKILFCILYLFFYIAVIFSAKIKNSFIRFFISLIYFLMFIFSDAYCRVVNDYMTYPDFISLLDAKGFVVEFIAQFYDPLMKSAFFGFLVFVGIMLIKRPVTPR